MGAEDMKPEKLSAVSRNSQSPDTHIYPTRSSPPFTAKNYVQVFIGTDPIQMIIQIILMLTRYTSPAIFLHTFVLPFTQKNPH